MAFHRNNSKSLISLFTRSLMNIGVSVFNGADRDTWYSWLSVLCGWNIRRVQLSVDMSGGSWNTNVRCVEHSIGGWLDIGIGVSWSDNMDHVRGLHGFSELLGLVYEDSVLGLESVLVLDWSHEHGVGSFQLFDLDILSGVMNKVSVKLDHVGI